MLRIPIIRYFQPSQQKLNEKKNIYTHTHIYKIREDIARQRNNESGEEKSWRWKFIWQGDISGLDTRAHYYNESQGVPG